MEGETYSHGFGFAEGLADAYYCAMGLYSGKLLLSLRLAVEGVARA